MLRESSSAEHDTPGEGTAVVGKKQASIIMGRLAPDIISGLGVGDAVVFMSGRRKEILAKLTQNEFRVRTTVRYSGNVELNWRFRREAASETLSTAELFALSEGTHLYGPHGEHMRIVKLEFSGPERDIPFAGTFIFEETIKIDYEKDRQSIEMIEKMGS